MSEEKKSFEETMSDTYYEYLKTAPIIKLERKDPYIYFISCNDEYLKIGKSNNVDKRLLGIETSNPYPLKLLVKCKIRELTEKRFHHIYTKLGRHHRKEWFILDDFTFKLIKYIEEYNKFVELYDPFEDNSYEYIKAKRKVLSLFTLGNIKTQFGLDEKGAVREED